MSEETRRKIGRYEIISLLGEGGMAQVHLAISHGPGGFKKLAVLKQIRPELASNASFTTLFLNEARLAARLHHPNIVQTFDVQECDGVYALAMEFLDGLPLSAIFKRVHPKALPLETHLWLLTQVLNGLHYAHTLRDYDGTPLRVVHLDVNPANVLVTYTGEVKLLDFGVAKMRGALAPFSNRTITGKPGYCSPEQLRAVEPDARADIFSVGVMLWEMLAGRRLSQSKDLMEAGRLRLSGKEPKIREVAPETDPALAAICDRALALDPEQRFASAAELRGELQAQLEKRGSHGRRVMVERLEEACARERQHLHGLIGTEMSRMHTSSRSPIARVEAPRSESSESSAITVPNASIQPSKWHLRALATAGMLALGVCVGLAARWTRARAPVMSTSPPISLSVTAPPSPVPALPGEGVVVPPPASPLAEETRPVPVVPSPPSPAPSEARPDSLSPTRTGRTRRPAPATTVVRVAEHVATPPTRARASAVASRSTGASRSPMEQPSATVQPGTHLVRPAKPVHCCLYEKDPYSP